MSHMENKIIFYFFPFSTGLSKLTSVPAGGAVAAPAVAAGAAGAGAAPAAGMCISLTLKLINGCFQFL